MNFAEQKKILHRLKEEYNKNINDYSLFANLNKYINNKYNKKNVSFD